MNASFSKIAGTKTLYFSVVPFSNDVTGEMNVILRFSSEINGVCVVQYSAETDRPHLISLARAGDW
jgi:hypothetical protein